MAESGPEPNFSAPAAQLAQSLAQTALGREPNPQEAAAVTTILLATIEALRHGYILRLADQVRVERDTESVEEFFLDHLKPT